MNPLHILFPKARGEILRLLFAAPERSLHLRELVRLSGMTIGTMQGEVRRLRSADLIVQRRDGNRLYFSANRDHPLFPELCGIALKTTGLVYQIDEALSGLGGTDFAFVFGSVAADEARSNSDIDLFIIGDVGLRQLAPRLRGVRDATGREVNPYVTSRESFKEKAGSGDAFIRNVIDAPKLWVKGSDHDLAELAQ
jgi:predicted nucleotidyltransferase